MARLGSMVVKGKLPDGCGLVCGAEWYTRGWRTYFGEAVGQAVEGGGFAGGWFAHEGDERVAGHGDGWFEILLHHRSGLTF